MKKLLSLLLAFVLSFAFVAVQAQGNEQLTKEQKKAIVENTFSGLDENVTVVYKNADVKPTADIIPMYESPMATYTVRTSPATRVGSYGWELLSGQDRVYMETGNYSVSSESVYFNILDIDNNEYVSSSFMGPVSRNSLIYYSGLLENTSYAFYVKAGPSSSSFTAQIGIITD